MSRILDQYGKPYRTEEHLQARMELDNELRYLRREIAGLQNKRVRAKYDAAQTVTGNIEHWSGADHLDPHAVANLPVRRLLRSRSRYEIIENNPYLKGVVLTIANDFVGKSGPMLQITDERLSPDRRKKIEDQYHDWARACFIRKKLWRMMIAKIVDGETFLRAYGNRNRLHKNPVLLDFQVIECDRVSSNSSPKKESETLNEIDGVRFDNYETPLEYYFLNSHPGGTAFLNARMPGENGTWVSRDYTIHWYRQERGWLRGIPEAAPSLPLCALLRRYTLAVVRHAEMAANLTGVMTSELPAGYQILNKDGTPVADDPFDTFPIEPGMVINLPYGADIKQLNAVPLGVQYDQFVGALLREITRPLMIPYNLAGGTSQDSNMASGVLDQHIYKGGQLGLRSDCEETVLDHMLMLWWTEASLVPGHLGSYNRSDRSFTTPPKHCWRWDRIGLDHTDPARVAEALKSLHDKRFLTDRDIQETWYNRDVDQWRTDVLEDDKFRKGLEDSGMTVQPKQEDRQAKQAAEQAKQVAKSKPKPGSGPAGKGKSSPPKKAKARRWLHKVDPATM
jgi:hypothetical protein